MIGIVLVTHGNLALEFLAALEHVVGPQQCLSTVCIGADDGACMFCRRAELRAAFRAKELTWADLCDALRDLEPVSS